MAPGVVLVCTFTDLFLINGRVLCKFESLTKLHLVGCSISDGICDAVGEVSVCDCTVFSKL